MVWIIRVFSGALKSISMLTPDGVSICLAGDISHWCHAFSKTYCSPYF